MKITEEQLEDYRKAFSEELDWFKEGSRDKKTLLDEIIATIYATAKREHD